MNRVAFFLGCCFLCILSSFSSAQGLKQPVRFLRTEVLVIGGGAGGVAAAVASARNGAETVLLTDQPWLGGMLSAAGVSATDGNHQLASGFWQEFRQALYKHYGGPSKLATGWVSDTQFEPHVADSIFKQMISAEKNIRLVTYTSMMRVLVKRKQVLGAVVSTDGGSLRIEALQTIDATELGDVMAMAGVPFSLGMESGALTGEKVGVTETNGIIQDLTYVAILKDYGAGRDCTIVKPAGYDPAEFDGSNSSYYHNLSRKKPTVDARKMLDYGRLPNGKYMLNWPIYGNDTYLDIVGLTPGQRDSALNIARQTTLRFVYFIQHELGFSNLGLADDEFPTASRLALIPYHREGRRLKGVIRYNMNMLAQPFSTSLYRTGVAVGDYPIDHHHKKNPGAPQHLEFYPVPSYNIPMGCLIPETFNGLIVAEKGISVSNVVNGTTRLQPVVLLTGQAAGTLAALAVRNKKQAREVPVRKLQQALLNQGAYLMPYNDVKPGHPQFLQIQKVGATGLLRGVPTPHGWANQTWFYPDSLLYAKDLAHWPEVFGKAMPNLPQGALSAEDVKKLLLHYGARIDGNLVPGNGTRPTRAELSAWVDQYLRPFERPVDLQGRFITH